MFVEVPTEALQEAIRHLHGCSSTFVEAFPVREEFEGKVVWEGVVNVFLLEGHPTAPKAYAWTHMVGSGERRKFVVVFHEGPVTSPSTAVTASIVSTIKKSQNRPHL